MGTNIWKLPIRKFYTIPRAKQGSTYCLSENRSHDIGTPSWWVLALLILWVQSQPFSYPCCTRLRWVGAMENSCWFSYRCAWVNSNRQRTPLASIQARIFDWERWRSFCVSFLPPDDKTKRLVFTNTTFTGTPISERHSFAKNLDAPCPCNVSTSLLTLIKYVWRGVFRTSYVYSEELIWHLIHLFNFEAHIFVRCFILT